MAALNPLLHGQVSSVVAQIFTQTLRVRKGRFLTAEPEVVDPAGCWYASHVLHQASQRCSARGSEHKACCAKAVLELHGVAREPCIPSLHLHPLPERKCRDSSSLCPFPALSEQITPGDERAHLVQGEAPPAPAQAGAPGRAVVVVPPGQPDGGPVPLVLARLHASGHPFRSCHVIHGVFGCYEGCSVLRLFLKLAVQATPLGASFLMGS